VSCRRKAQGSNNERGPCPFAIVPCPADWSLTSSAAHACPVGGVATVQVHRPRRASSSLWSAWEIRIRDADINTKGVLSTALSSVGQRREHMASGRTLQQGLCRFLRSQWWSSAAVFAALKSSGQSSRVHWSRLDDISGTNRVGLDTGVCCGYPLDRRCYILLAMTSKSWFYLLVQLIEALLITAVRRSHSATRIPASVCSSWSLRWETARARTFWCKSSC
jgi:hypothetical protein